MSTQIYEATQPAEDIIIYPGGYKEPYCDVVLQVSFDDDEASAEYTNYTLRVFYLPRRNETRNPAIWDTRFMLDSMFVPSSPAQVQFPASGSQTLVAGDRTLWYTMSFRLKNDGTQHKLAFSGVCKSTAPRFFPNYPLSITFTTPKQTTEDTSKVFVKVNGTWHKAIPWVKVSGVWKKAKAWVKVNGEWKSTNS